MQYVWRTAPRRQVSVKAPTAVSVICILADAVMGTGNWCVFVVQAEEGRTLGCLGGWKCTLPDTIWVFLLPICSKLNKDLTRRGDF